MKRLYTLSGGAHGTTLLRVTQTVTELRHSPESNRTWEMIDREEAAETLREARGAGFTITRTKES